MTIDSGYTATPSTSAPNIPTSMADHSTNLASTAGMDPHPHFTTLLDRLHGIQLAEIQSPHPLADQITDLKRHWARLALLAQHVPANMATPNVAIHGHLNLIPLLATAAPPIPLLEQQRDIRNQVEQGLKDQLTSVVEHGLGQEITSQAQLSTATHRLLTSLPPPISSPTTSQLPPPSGPQPASAAAATDHLALSLSSTLTHLTSLLSTHTSLTSSTTTSTQYFSHVAQVALAKLDLLAATVRAHDAPQVTLLVRAVSQALGAKKHALERELAHVKGEIRVYEELGPEFAGMCREVRRVRSEVERVRAEVERLRSTGTTTGGYA